MLLTLSVLAGLFAMHGLSQHGEHLADAAATAAVDHVGHGSTAVAAVPAPPVLAADPDSSPADGSGAVTLCLTVLAAACLAAWAATRPRGGVLRTLAPARAATPRPPVRARDPDPPDRWTLSVCRC